MNSTKPLLRKQLTLQLSKVSPQDLRAASVLIANSVSQEIRKRNIQPLLIHMYEPNDAWFEVDTSILLGRIHAEFPECIVDQPEASKNAQMSQKQYDVIIIPCLGFDARRNRLGRGAGWYDRFLATQPTALKIGIALDLARCEGIPVEAHDQVLNLVTTEKAVYDSQGK